MMKDEIILFEDYINNLSNKIKKTNNEVNNSEEVKECINENKYLEKNKIKRLSK